MSIPNSLDQLQTQAFVESSSVAGKPGLVVLNPDGSNITAGGGAAIGGTIAGGTTGSVLFIGAASTLAQDNANLFWDDTNNRLGIGINTPSETLEVSGTGYFSGHTAFGPDAGIDALPLDPQYSGLGYTFSTIQTLEESFTDFSTIWLVGQVISIGCNPSAPPVGFAYTQVLDVFTDPANAEDFVVIDGLYVSPAHFGTGQITGALTGIQVQNLIDVAAGNVAALYDYVSLSENGGTLADHACYFLQFINTGTITNNYGTLIATPVDSGSIDNNYGIYIEDQSGIGSTESINLVSLGASSSNYLQGSLQVDGIYFGSSGTAAASNDYAFTANQMLVSGNTTINAIVTPATTTAGTSLTLIFSGTPTVKHNTAGGAGTAKIFLAGGVDLTAAANFVLGLVYDGTQWQETFRKSPT